jgi:hypothetical protein
MATYQEMHDLTHNTALLNRVMAAVAVLAEAIRGEAPATANHAERMRWAQQALRNVDGTARSLMWIVIAQNRAATAAQIEGASDAAVQTAVNSAVELLI